MNLFTPFFRKPITLGAAILFSVTFLTSCTQDCGPTKGEVLVNRPVTVAQFQSIELETEANVVISEGLGQTIELTGFGKALDNLEFIVKDGKLKIKGDKTCDYKGNLPEIKITIPLVKDLSIDGSGTINTGSTLAGESHEFKISGSGMMMAAVNSKELTTKISGSGMLTLSGNSAKTTHSISGSGMLHSFELLSATCEVDVSGSGSAEVWVNGTLDSNISGSGNVNYKGSPVIKNEVSGSGKLMQVQ